MNSPAEYLKKSPFSGQILLDAPMKNRCTFKSGGPAETLVIPESLEDILIVRTLCAEKNIPLFILGGGANILVSDKGIKGITLSMEKMATVKQEDNTLICGAGLSVNAMVSEALERSLSGLEFLSRLPGSVGGALYMNARCYGAEVADIFDWAEVLTLDHKVKRIPFNKADWAYKISPFQEEGLIILKGAFRLSPGEKSSISSKMNEIALSRREKGHFRAPSAGSTFKNNRDFGKPSGQIIDECGLKGLSLGGASVSDWHGNILINREGASSEDISRLIIEVQNKVKEQTGFYLEPEVLRVGDWN
ncbi:MAG: UDP-N-acetylmuramate dehydrogenase [Spirochaetales bacterium]|nr:UDP-N-acetylmuramate dehydrogenase [Spirochaetales bacterium]